MKDQEWYNVCGPEEFTNVKQLFRQRFDLYYLPADFLAIATQRLGMPNIGAVKSCLTSTQHEGESEQDFTAKLVKQFTRSNIQ
jgi:hypothetical protein